MSQMTPSPSMPQSPGSGDWPDNAVPEAWIDSLFGKMSAYYGSRFSDMWRGTDLSDVRRAWAVELAGVSRNELKAGVAALITRNFPPTLPEFIGLCRPPFNLDAALDEALAQMIRRQSGEDNWTDPAIYWAMARVGHWDMTHLSRDDLKKRFAACYDDVKRKGKVDPVPPSMNALPKPGQGVTDVHAAQANIAKVKEIIEKARRKTMPPEEA